MNRTFPSSAALGRSATQAAPSGTLSTTGLAAATGAFVMWGVFPLYLHGLHSVSALEITAHRITSSFILIIAWMAGRGELRQIGAALSRPGVLPRLIATASLISINWLAFVWAVSNDRVVEVSLGYYLNPLLNVVLGIVVLSERLSRVQWTAVALAASGVAYLTLDTGHLPWVTLTVAVSFGLYGLIRKTAKVDALPGLAIETMLLVPLALGFLIWSEVNGTAAFGHTIGFVDGLLVGSGLVTAVPLFLFAYGARHLPYSTLGVLQYIAPSLQLLCAVFFLGERFERANAIGFSLIWVALAIYAAEGLWRSRRSRRATQAVTADDSRPVYKQAA